MPSHALSTPRCIWSSSILEEGLEVALSEAVVSLGLDEFEEDRADHGFREELHQHARLAAAYNPLAVD
jgi:hypothetical protein